MKYLTTSLRKITRLFLILVALGVVCEMSLNNLPAQTETGSEELSSEERNTIPAAAECVATTRQIRTLMRQISEQGEFSLEILQELDAAFARNRLFFVNARDLPDIRSLLFASDTSEEHHSDYDLYWKTYRALMANARDKEDIHSFTTMLKMNGSLRPVVRNNAEWSEHLEYFFEDLALAAPKAMVLYFADESQAEFTKRLGNLWIFCELPEKKKELYDKINDLDLKEQRHIVIIEKIKEELNSYCTKYWDRIRAR